MGARGLVERRKTEENDDNEFHPVESTIKCTNAFEYALVRASWLAFCFFFLNPFVSHVNQTRLKLSS